MHKYSKPYMAFLMTSLALTFPQDAQGMDSPTEGSSLKRPASSPVDTDHPNKRLRVEINEIQDDTAQPSPSTHQPSCIYPYDQTEEEAQKARIHNNKVESHTIKSIDEIHGFLKGCSVESTLVVFDWDDTVVSTRTETFREKTTKEVIKRIREQGFDLLYLTARLQGQSIKESFFCASQWENYKCLNRFVDSMNLEGILDGYQTLKSVPTNHPELYGKVLMDLPIFRKKDRYNKYMSLTNNIVFSGPDKGPALAMLLDLNRFGSETPDEDYIPFFNSDRVYNKIVFVDDLEHFIGSMKHAFKGRPEDLVTLYYPN